MPTVTKISRGQIMADRKYYTVDVKYEGDKRTTRVSFQGPARGMGMITMGLSGYTTTVDRPERFGSEFNAEWCERFMTTPLEDRKE